MKFLIQKTYLLEACIDSMESGMEAVAKGADMLELCSSLELDGLTPSLGTALSLKEASPTPIKIMIRCREGNFQYSAQELSSMKTTMLEFYDAGFRNFVFGAMTEDGRVDEDAIDFIFADVPDTCNTFHKAIDQSVDLFEDIKCIKSYKNFCYILSSGTMNTALEGGTILKLMKEACSPQIQLIAAGKVTADNIQALHSDLNLEIYHGRKIV